MPSSGSIDSLSYLGLFLLPTGLPLFLWRDSIGSWSLVYNWSTWVLLWVMIAKSSSSFETWVSIAILGCVSTAVTWFLPNQDKMLLPVWKSYYNLLCCFNAGCSYEAFPKITSVFTFGWFYIRACGYYEGSGALPHIAIELLESPS